MKILLESKDDQSHLFKYGYGSREFSQIKDTFIFYTFRFQYEIENIGVETKLIEFVAVSRKIFINNVNKVDKV